MSIKSQMESGVQTTRETQQPNTIGPARPLGVQNPILHSPPRGQRKRNIGDIDYKEVFRRVGAEHFRPDILKNVSGPFMAKVLWVYPPDTPPAETTPYLSMRQPPNVSVVIARINELHAHLPDPTQYSMNGTQEEQRDFWASIALHKEIGLFLPEDLTPDYPVPSVGEEIRVDYSNINEYKGGVYYYSRPQPVGLDSMGTPVVEEQDIRACGFCSLPPIGDVIGTGDVDVNNINSQIPGAYGVAPETPEELGGPLFTAAASLGGSETQDEAVFPSLPSDPIPGYAGTVYAVPTEGRNTGYRVEPYSIDCNIANAFGADWCGDYALQEPKKSIVESVQDVCYHIESFSYPETGRGSEFSPTGTEILYRIYEGDPTEPDTGQGSNDEIVSDAIQDDPSLADPATTYARVLPVNCCVPFPIKVWGPINGVAIRWQGGETSFDDNYSPSQMWYEREFSGRVSGFGVPVDPSEYYTESTFLFAQSVRDVSDYPYYEEVRKRTATTQAFLASATGETSGPTSGGDIPGRFQFISDNDGPAWVAFDNNNNELGDLGYRPVECSSAMLRPIVEMCKILRAEGIIEMWLGGMKPVCRLKNTSDDYYMSLSSHGIGYAWDIYGFLHEDGTVFSTQETWYLRGGERSPGSGPCCPEDWTSGEKEENPDGYRFHLFMEKIAQANIFSQILGPNYNPRHRNHFHVGIEVESGRQINTDAARSALHDACGTGPDGKPKRCAPVSWITGDIQL